MKNIIVQNFKIGQSEKLVFIAGPCVVENKKLVFKVAEKLKRLSEKLDFNLIFKSSYKKANRTSLKGFTTLGIDESIKILSDVKKEFSLPILTDVHTTEEISFVKDIADVLQIPAFLCRQTDLLLAAGKTSCAVNIKKGQFLAPGDMKFPIEKVLSTGNKNILVTERGTSFGYHDLVVDMRGLVEMKKFGFPVIMDVTHSVQKPSARNGKSGGAPEFIFPLARAAAAVGVNGFFIETHPNPAKAFSDAESQLPLDKFEKLAIELMEIHDVTRKF